MTTCTRSHRMQELDCQVFTDDGTFWLIFKACTIHGVEGEHTPIYSPRIDLNDEAADGESAAVKLGA
jgi:hypothetical protein